MIVTIVALVSMAIVAVASLVTSARTVDKNREFCERMMAMHLQPNQAAKVVASDPPPQPDNGARGISGRAI